MDCTKKRGKSKRREESRVWKANLPRLFSFSLVCFLLGKFLLKIKKTDLQAPAVSTCGRAMNSVVTHLLCKKLFRYKTIILSVDERIMALKLIRVAATVFPWPFLRWCGFRYFFAVFRTPHLPLHSQSDPIELYLNRTRTQSMVEFNWVRQSNQIETHTIIIEGLGGKRLL